MEYELLSNPGEIRCLFMEQFVEPFEAFSAHHQEWTGQLRTVFNKEYYDKMFMWDRIIPQAHPICFSDALAVLRDKKRDVWFLTESVQCAVNEFCRLNNQKEFAAVAAAEDLAQCVSYEWYTEYELFAQGCYLADPILPSDLYVFDQSYSWCLIFTHETDETESADSRFCLFVDLKERSGKEKFRNRHSHHKRIPGQREA